MLLILACLFLLLAGGGLAFGPLNVKMDKLRPGQSPQDAIKKTRRMGYIIIGISIILLLFIIFVIMTMTPRY